MTSASSVVVQTTTRDDNPSVVGVPIRLSAIRSCEPPPIIEVRDDGTVFAVHIASEKENLLSGFAVVLQTVIRSQVDGRRNECRSICTVGFELLNELTVEVLAKRTLREVVAVALIEGHIADGLLSKNKNLVLFNIENDAIQAAIVDYARRSDFDVCFCHNENLL